MKHQLMIWLVSAGLLASAGCGHDKVSTPTAPSTPSAPETPSTFNPTARLNLMIDGARAQVAIAVLSKVRFDLTPSISSSAVQYAIDYGDGRSSTEAVSTHTYQAPGSYVVSATVTDSTGRRSVITQTVVVRTVEGTWYSAAYNSVRGDFEVRHLSITTQDGLLLRGEFLENGHPGRPAAVVTGVLEGDRGIRLNVPGEPEIVGGVPSTVSGELAILELRGFGATTGTLSFQPVAGSVTGPSPTAQLDVQVNSQNDHTAISGYSRVRFSAAGSRGDRLMTFIEYGDGGTSSDDPSFHTFTTGPFILGRPVGRFTIRLTVVDRFGRSDSVSVPLLSAGLVHPQGRVYSLTYGWISQTPSTFLRLGFERQEGAVASGFLNPGTAMAKHFTAAISGERDIRIVFDDGSGELVGTIIVNDPYDDVSSSYNRHLLLTTRGLTIVPDGTRLDFEFYDPF